MAEVAPKIRTCMAAHYRRRLPAMSAASGRAVRASGGLSTRRKIRLVVRRALAPLLAGPVFFCACGGRSQQSEGEAPSVPSDIAAACTNEESIACMTEDSCEGGFATLIYGSVGNCISRRTRECELEVASLGTAYGAPEITTCAMNQAAQTCDEWIGTLTPGCGFNGTKAVGEPCLYNAQCASRLCDAFRYNNEREVCGVCASLPSEGDACSSSCGAEGVLSCEYAGS